MNPLNELTGRLEALKADLAAKAEAVVTNYRSRIDTMFSDIDAEETPVASSIRGSGDSMLDLIDGAVHAIAELEKRLPDKQGKAA